MSTPLKPVTILVADDDTEDLEFVQEALQAISSETDFRTVSDGVELLEYLRREGRYADLADSPRPALILLDLKMPRMGGLEALNEIKTDQSLALIPIVVLSTSGAAVDVVESYNRGANSYIRKPTNFDELSDTMKTLVTYWFKTVALPKSDL